MKKNSFIEYSSDVVKAMEKGKPVVALETTMLTHGAPYPQNFEIAKKIDAVIRGEGATPAFVAVIGGKLKAGLSAEELDYICKAGEDLKKAGRRDIALLCAAGEDGSSTVSAALLTASLSDIPVVAIGGIGGVHRGGENSMDISADLEELSRANVLAISAGPKTLLDVGLTLEYLETKGVPVIGYGTDEVPAFFTRNSGFKADYTLESPSELARAYRIQRQLGVPGGMLVANPVPRQFAMDATVLNRAIDMAMNKAAELGVRGRQLTPFLLTLIKEMTGGKSAEADAAVALGNARLAAQVAVVLSAITDEDDAGGFDPALLAHIKKSVADDLEDEMEEELEENLGKEILKLREQLRTEFTEMLAASGTAAATKYAPAYTASRPAPQPTPAAPVTVGSGAPPVLDDRPFVAFVPGQSNERHGPAAPAEPEPEPEHDIEHEPEHEAESEVSSIPDEYRADSVPEDEPELEPVVIEAEEETVETVDEPEPEPEPEPAAEEELTVYDPNKYRAKHESERAGHDDDGNADPVPGSTTEYDPDAYRQRALDRKRRMAIASGEPIPEEAKTDEDRHAESVALVDCKGPLEFTGEHPLAWKCTRCGQLFEKHEIPHKRPKLPDE